MFRLYVLRHDRIVARIISETLEEAVVMGLQFYSPTADYHSFELHPDDQNVPLGCSVCRAVDAFGNEYAIYYK